MNYSYRKYKIQPSGRNKYGNYISNQNMAGNITYATYAGNESTNNNKGGDSSQGDQQNQPVQPKSYIMFLSNTQGNFEGALIAQAPQTARTQLISYVNEDPEVAYVGDFSGHTGISGMCSGMSVSVLNNYTSAVTIEITMTSALTNPLGTLIIPCYMPKNGEQPGSDLGAWGSLNDGEDLHAQTFEWNWSVNVDATSVYVLDLTNEMAGVNCDSDGNVLSGVTLPTTTARLYFGDTLLSGVTFACSVPSSYHASGVVFDTSTGILSFSNDLAFDGNQMAITISAIYGGQSREKIFNLVKNFPGENGESPVTRWLIPSTSSVIFDSASSSFTPSTVSCEMWKQVGSSEPVSANDADVYWRFDNSDGWSAYTLNSAITIEQNSATSVMFAIKSSGSSWYFYELETVPILKNGSQGTPGPQGLAGPAVRGPIDWYSGITVPRHFCNGSGPADSDKLFIDVLLKDGNYYKCVTSFTMIAGDDWDDVRDNFELSDEEYNFVATNLLLAENAKINFLTNNAIQLLDSGGTISGGAAGGTGTDIAFWAGSPSPANAPFKVDHNGELSATTGHFGFMKISNNIRYLGNGIEGEKVHTSGEYSGETDVVMMSPGAIWFKNENSSGDTQREAIIGATQDYYDYANAIAYFDTQSNFEAPTAITSSSDTAISQFEANTRVAINAVGKVRSSLFTTTRNDVPQYNTTNEMGMLATPGLFNLPMVFVIQDSGYTEYSLANYIGKCMYGENAGYWVFRGTNGYPTSWTYNGEKCWFFSNVSSGISTGIKWATYPYPFIAGSVTGTGMDSDLLGHIGFARTMAAAVSPDYTCVFLPMQTTAATKKNHIMYIEIE